MRLFKDRVWKELHERVVKDDFIGKTGLWSSRDSEIFNSYPFKLLCEKVEELENKLDGNKIDVQKIIETKNKIIREACQLLHSCIFKMANVSHDEWVNGGERDYEEIVTFLNAHKVSDIEIPRRECM